MKKSAASAALFLSFTDEPVVLEDQIVHVAAQNFLFFLFHAFSLLANSLPEQYMPREVKSCTKRCKREKFCVRLDKRGKNRNNNVEMTR